MSAYEFTQEENQVFETLSKRIARLGVLFIIIGVAVAINGIGVILNEGKIAATLSTFVMSAIQIIIGIIIWRPADNFRHIVTTKGQDIDELMIGLNELSAGFGVMRFLMLINVVIIIVQIMTIFSL